MQQDMTSAHDAQGSTGGGTQVLTFLLGVEEYGVDILKVQEIRGWDHATPIPNTPTYVKGVINLRGTIVPIVDLRSRLSMDVRGYDSTTVVIVLKIASPTREKTMGVVVDAVSDVHYVPVQAVRPAPSLGSIDADYVSGLATVDDKMLIMLDVDSLLNSGEVEESPAAA